MSTLDVDTPHGPARVHLHPVDKPKGAVVIGHGAGGGVGARDIQAALKVANELGYNVALVEQPYRVAGRKSPAPAPQLDEAWTAVIAQLRKDRFIPQRKPLITAGRSSGARVACRTATATKASAVLCLAFPLHPPGRPEKTRLPELDGAGVPVLVVQGASDPFGVPRSAKAKDRTVVRIKGNHSLASDMPALKQAVADWLSAASR